MKFCPACSVEVENIIEHLQESQCSKKILKIASSSIKLESITFCKICQEFFEHSAYRIHSKSCLRKSKSKSKASSAESFFEENIGVDTLKKKQKIDESVNLTLVTEKALSLREMLPQSCMELAKAKLTFFTQSWLEKNRSINEAVLYNIYDLYLKRVTRELEEIIPEVKITDLYSISRKIQWGKFIKNTPDLFDKKLIFDRIREQTQNLKEQNKILSALNTYYRKFPDIFTQFELHKIPRELPENPRNKLPLLPDTLFEFVKWLFSSEIRRLIHFGIDLLLMFQSGLRFPSSMNEIKTRFLPELEKKEKGPLAYETIQTKTSSKFAIVIDSQLVHLMKLSEWKGFAFPPEFYKRMTKFLEFSLYSLRRGYLCFIVSFNSFTDLNSSKLLSQHASAKSLSFYVKNVLIAELLRAKLQLRMSNIKDFEAKDYELPSNLRDVVAIKLPDKWKEKCWSFLLQYVDIEDKLQVFEKPVEFTVPQKIEPVEQKEQETKQELQYTQNISDFDESESEVEVKKVKIRNTLYEMTDGMFNIASLYTAAKNESCTNQKISEHQNMKFRCNECYNVYCESCEILYFCSCMKVNLQEQASTVAQTHKSKIELQMPDSYMDNELIDLMQIRFVIHARGYYFTNVCVESCDMVIPDVANDGEISLPNFQKYIEMKYFPPIKIQSFGEESGEGEGFGLFATENIEPHVFIGEYAADKVPIYNERFISRKDMVFDLGEKFKPTSIVIGPLQYCGYVPLINEDKNNMNCKASTVVVNGKVRIIVYTSKKIHEGEQLFYDYGRENAHKMENVHQMDIEEEEDLVFFGPVIRQKPLVEQVKMEETNYLLIKNQNNCCYMIVVAQLLYEIREDIFFIPDSQDEVVYSLKSLIQHQGNFNNFAEAIYDSTSTFPKNVESDTHEFLDFLLARLPKLPALTTIEDIKLQCSNCENCSLQTSEIYTIPLHMSRDFSSLFEYESEVEDFRCEACKSPIIFSKTNYHFLSSVKYFLIHLLRFNQNQKNKDEKIFLEKVEHDQLVFELKFIVCHIGEQKTGHYYIYDYEKKIKINGSHISSSMSIETEAPYLLLYKKKENDE